MIFLYVYRYYYNNIGTNNNMNNNMIQQNTGGYGMFSPQQLIDYTFTNYIMGSMSKLADKEFSINIVFTVILLLSLQELKVILIDILKATSEFIKTNYKDYFSCVYNWIKHYVVMCISPIYRFLWRKKESRNNENNVICTTEDIKYYSMQYDIKYSLTFMQNLIKYIKDNSTNCNYFVDDNKKIDIKNFEEMNVTETWKRIKIKYDGININIMNNLSLTFVKKQSMLFLTGVEEHKNDVLLNSVYTFSDLMPNSHIKEYVKKFVTIAEIDKIIPEYIDGVYVSGINPNYLHHTVRFYDNIDNCSNTSFELCIILLLQTCCRNINVIDRKSVV